MDKVETWLTSRVPVPDSTVFVILAVLTIYVLLHKLFLKPLFFSPLRKLPGPPFGHFLYGQFRNIVRAEAGAPQSEWAEKYGAVIRPVGPFGIEHMIFLGPAALHRILVSHWSDFPRADFWRHVLGLSAGYGLLTHTGLDHKQMRHAVNPGFSLRNIVAQMVMYYPPIEGLVEILRNQISSQPNPEAGVEVLIHDWVYKVTLDIICATTLGHHPDTVHQPEHPLARSYHMLSNLQNGSNMAKLMAIVTIPGIPWLMRTEFAYKIRKLLRGPLLSPGRNLIESMHYIRSFARTVVAERVAEAEEYDQQTSNDVMSVLVRDRMNADSDKYRLSDEALVENAISFLSAGHATSACAVSWALLLLAKSPAVQDRLRAEVTPLVAREKRPGHQGLKDCQWLHCVVMETLRLFPSIPMVMRQAGEAGWVDGVYLPKGTQIYIPIRVVNMWSQIWGDDAKEFRPERWLALPPGYDPKFSFLSFTAGAHACIGRTMGLLQTKAIIAVLISHFTFAPAYEGQVAKPTATVTLKPADDTPLRVAAVEALPSVL